MDNQIVSENNTAKFAFASFCAQDKERIEPLLSQLVSEGYSIRFGGDAEAADCDKYYAFITKNWLTSQSETDECADAIAKGKPVMAVYLDDVAEDDIPESVREGLADAGVFRAYEVEIEGFGFALRTLMDDYRVEEDSEDTVAAEEAETVQYIPTPVVTKKEDPYEDMDSFSRAVCESWNTSRTGVMLNKTLLIVCAVVMLVASYICYTRMYGAIVVVGEYFNPLTMQYSDFALSYTSPVKLPVRTFFYILPVIVAAVMNCTAYCTTKINARTVRDCAGSKVVALTVGRLLSILPIMCCTDFVQYMSNWFTSEELMEAVPVAAVIIRFAAVVAILLSVVSGTVVSIANGRAVNGKKSSVKTLTTLSKIDSIVSWILFGVQCVAGVFVLAGVIASFEDIRFQYYLFVAYAVAMLLITKREMDIRSAHNRFAVGVLRNLSK